MIEPNIHELSIEALESYLHELYDEMRPLNERVQYLHYIAEQVQLERIRRRSYVAV